MLLKYAVLVITVTVSVYCVTQDAMERCHQGLRDGRTRCGEYANIPKRAVREVISRNLHGRVQINKRQVPQEETEDANSDKLNCELYEDTEYYQTCVDCEAGERSGEECSSLPRPDLVDPVEYPEIDQTSCLELEWGTGKENNAANNYGNCMNMTTDETYRYITSNNVPDFYMNPYCPIGLGFGYCVQQEIDAGTCYFTGLTCGDEDNGAGTTDFGDVWVPQEDNYKILLKGNPTREDRPADMYDITAVGGSKTNGAATGVAINGIGIQGPNDAGDVSIDEAGFQLACGGHVTPPLGNEDTTGEVPSGPPKYHFHKSPECLTPFTDASKGLAAGGEPYEHAKLMGWAIDGFGIYAYQEEGGEIPVVDECGGHFGPTDTGEVVYHYHSRVIVPYHLACQGPSLGKCNTTQSGTNYCHPGCGHEVCVQPGTSEKELREYLSQWNETWLDMYDVNPFNSATLHFSFGLGLIMIMAQLLL